MALSAQDDCFGRGVVWLWHLALSAQSRLLCQKSLQGLREPKWRLTCIWWRRLILYLSLGLGCMVVSAPQMISEPGALSANVKVMAEEPLEWSRF